MPPRTAAAFPTVRSEGGLLPPDLLQRIVQLDAELGGFRPEDYGLQPGERLTEAISHDWRKVQNFWAAFQSATEDLPPAESGVSETREQWLLPLLRTLGYRPEFQREAEDIGNRRYFIPHRDGPVLLHLVSFRQDLDHAANAAGQRRADPGSPPSSPRRGGSPHAELQELLNLSEGRYLYGLASNGHMLRLLRDSHSLTRLTYLEFDLKGMLEGGVYADFVLLWLALHRSRLPKTAEAARDCWLERWRDKAEAQGARAMGALRGGVEQALKALGGGLLAHPANEALRVRLRSGELTTQAFYGQLLRLLYRILFLFVAEERGLLFKPGAPEADISRYTRWYSLSRLRDLSARCRTDERHDDLWRSVHMVFDILGGRRQGLGLPELGGLFAPESCPDLDGALISNAALTEAIARLSWVRVDKRWRRVNYRDIDAEELGGVYEALLERQPDVCADEGNAHFDFTGSGQRKQTGSYYTPSELVDELIRSALDPVIVDRLKAARTPADQERVLLSISVCDSATGSGHFLLAAARRIARELARVKAGDREPSPAERREALRQVIRHCIYGVDANPLAVDLCKMALWLEGHDAGLPLTFLDHRIKLGNSLIGATPDLLRDGIPDGAYEPITGDDKKLAASFKKVNREEAKGQKGLWQAGEWQGIIHGFGEQAQAIAELPESEAADVRRQRSRYQSFERQEVEPARAVLDAWTAAFFWPLQEGAPEPPTTDALRVPAGRPPALSPAQQREVARLREQLRFFHWPLEFPEVFDRRGFDCVLGNPPWERIKLQELEFFAERDREIAEAPNKAARQKLIERLPETEHGRVLHQEFQQALRAAEGQSKFVRASGRFPLTAIGDVNVYALFAEHDRSLLNGSGRAGIVVPTGIATDDSTKRFFQDVTERGSLATLYDFENRKVFFEDVHASYKFSLLTLSGGRVAAGDLAFFLTSTGQLTDEHRRFQLTPEDFALLNPNTRTCPIFRTSADAELTRAIYRRVPVLVDEASANPWGVQFLRMFDMSNDSGLFRDQPGPTCLPLYEAKLFHQFNHRWATYEDGDARDVLPAELADPSFRVRPRYWVERAGVEDRLEGRWEREWLIAFRNIARATDERTTIATAIPRVGIGHSAPLILPKGAARKIAALIANLLALPFDYVVRQKLGGIHLDFHQLKQFPVLPPTAYTDSDLAFIVPRVLELTYTAWDLQPFARDLAYEGEPFRWDPDRRALLRADLDAYYAALYGLTRDELRYILDPKDVYGEDFPGETFRVLKEREIKEYGEYRTRRLVLEAWDRLGLAPRNRDGRYNVPAAPAPPRAGARTNGSGHSRAEELGSRPSSSRRGVRPPEDVLPGPSKLPSQQTLFASPLEAPAGRQSDADLRRRALQLALRCLQAGPMTARELACAIADPAIDRHLVNSVLFNEGKGRVRHDFTTHTYRLTQPAAEPR
jgi:hypothetical protein